jgi:membrane protein
MQAISPASPEQRAKDSRWNRSLKALRPGARAYEVVKRIVVGVYADGFIHAGNLAYLSLLTLFPFFIVTAALAHVLGRGPDAMVAIDNVIGTLPRSVRVFLRPTIVDVLAQRTGSLLWLGGLVGLWTTGSFIETIREILRRAYGVAGTMPFWRYRLGAAAITIVAVMLMLTAFSVQLAMTAAELFVLHLMPFAFWVVRWIGWSKLAPLIALFGALYLIFYTLTPSKYRYSASPKWAGAAFTTLWWGLMTTALPRTLTLLGGYGRTYGSLAGVIVALLFFWLVGFGLVIGAHLNAALAETIPESLKGEDRAVAEG